MNGIIRNFLWQGFSLVESTKFVLLEAKSIRYRTIVQKMGCSNSKSIDITNSKTQDKCSMQENKPEEEYVEDVVCNLSDLAENELKTVDLDEGKVLLVKQRGVVSAIGTKCTHYGAPLVGGALGDGRVRCQWHGACFNILTGDIEDFPGLDSLPCYKVTIDDGKVKVRAKKSDLAENKRIKKMVTRDSKEDQHIVVVGGGPSGAVCVETLRQEGFSGKITFVCKEKYLPYDRVKVSKAMGFEIEKTTFRNESFYKENCIDVLLNVEATSVDTNAKTVTLGMGKSIKYDKLYIATGCVPRKLRVPGSDFKNVVLLRDYDDASYTNSLLSEDKEVVILGSSFVAMEAANYCQNKVKKVTVIFRGELPFQPFLGPEIGAAVLELFKSKNINFVTNSGITEVKGDNEGNVCEVVLPNGSTLRADILITGIGSTYSTDFVKNSGIQMRSDGTIETNEYLQTNVPEVFVGGDIAFAPVWCHNNEKSAIGHYPLAHYHGRIAALNILGKKAILKGVPYFWTMLFGKSIRYAGYGSYDKIIYDGDVSDLKFVAFYLKDGIVVAASSCNRDPVVSQFAELLAQGKKLTEEELIKDPLGWTKNIVPN
ncbi:unnamed protein product [Phyllotreta striolata]|uniref:Rieske domain-containing protein n=1 Tax=Phyllotreta striolata TaxID=444603 RepID=A0A9N9T9E2_PHYSR|nr:unnamed protein product [Phyllotreta striolata]